MLLYAYKQYRKKHGSFLIESIIVLISYNDLKIISLKATQNKKDVIIFFEKLFYSNNLFENNDYNVFYNK